MLSKKTITFYFIFVMVNASINTVYGDPVYTDFQVKSNYSNASVILSYTSGTDEYCMYNGESDNYVYVGFNNSKQVDVVYDTGDLFSYCSVHHSSITYHVTDAVTGELIGSFEWYKSYGKSPKMECTTSTFKCDGTDITIQ